MRRGQRAKDGAPVLVESRCQEDEHAEGKQSEG
jgi:hypothetical protein